MHIAALKLFIAPLCCLPWSVGPDHVAPEKEQLQKLAEGTAGAIFGFTKKLIPHWGVRVVIWWSQVKENLITWRHRHFLFIHFNRKEICKLLVLHCYVSVPKTSFGHQEVQERTNTWKFTALNTLYKTFSKVCHPFWKRSSNKTINFWVSHAMLVVCHSSWAFWKSIQILAM